MVHAPSSSVSTDLPLTRGYTCRRHHCRLHRPCLHKHTSRQIRSSSEPHSRPWEPVRVEPVGPGHDLAWSLPSQDTTYHSQADCFVWHFHRQLKAACRRSDWKTALPPVILCIRALLKEDLGHSNDELVVELNSVCRANFLPALQIPRRAASKTLTLASRTSCRPCVLYSLVPHPRRPSSAEASTTACTCSSGSMM